MQVGPADGLVLPGVLRSARQHQLDVESFTADEVGRRFPGFVAAPDCAAVLETGAGFLYVERCVLAHLAEARRHGAELRSDVTVRSWRTSGDDVVVETDQGAFAAVRLVIAAGAFALIAYLAGRVDYAAYLGIPHVPGAGELAILCAGIMGAGLAFLWFNAPPAAVFMGDTGSLALGGALGAIAVASHHEIVLAIVGGLFVLEAASVIIQVFWFKRTGRRVFRMAPIHHHFEQKGWAESTVVIRFWIVSIILAVIGLSTLKLR